MYISTKFNGILAFSWLHLAVIFLFDCLKFTRIIVLEKSSSTMIVRAPKIRASLLQRSERNFFPSTPTALNRACVRTGSRHVCLLAHYARDLNVAGVGAPLTLVSPEFPIRELLVSSGFECTQKIISGKNILNPMPIRFGNLSPH